MPTETTLTDTQLLLLETMSYTVQAAIAKHVCLPDDLRAAVAAQTIYDMVVAGWRIERDSWGAWDE
jgi:hypothetical protein